MPLQGTLSFFKTCFVCAHNILLEVVVSNFGALVT